MPSVPLTEPLLVKPPEAARLLGLSPRTLWSLTKMGKIPHIRLGERSVRYSRMALADFCAQQTVAGPH